jgi:UDP-galactopyranose mutase
VNFPDAACGPHIRQIEWKHMLPRESTKHIRGTVLTREFPMSPSDPDQYEYPFPDRRNVELYTRYSRRAQMIRNLVVCGRLGEYKYYDMDQVIARAMMRARSMLSDRQRKAA